MPFPPCPAKLLAMRQSSKLRETQTANTFWEGRTYVYTFV